MNFDQNHKCEDSGNVVTFDIEDYNKFNANTKALYIYAYVMTRPNGHIFKKTDFLHNKNIKKRKLPELMRFLKKIGFVEKQAMIHAFVACTCRKYKPGLCDCFVPNIKEKYCERRERRRVENNEYRVSYEYKKWRASVYKRDNFTCQDCGVRGGELNAHHIKPYSKFINLRTDINNGVTLCVDCHTERHKKTR